MAAVPTKKSSAKTVRKPKAAAGKIRSVSFGSVTIKVLVPTPGQVKKRLVQSKRVAGTIGKVLANPGVAIDFKPTTPVFIADPENPELVIRKLGDESVRGRFQENGQFVVL